MNTIEQLKQHMESNNLSTHDLTRELDITLGTVYRWLRGKGYPSRTYETIIKNYLQKECVK